MCNTNVSNVSIMILLEYEMLAFNVQMLSLDYVNKISINSS